MNADVRRESVALDDDPSLDDAGGGAHLDGESRIVLAEDAIPSGANAERAVGEGETRREAAVEPHAKGIPLGDVIFYDRFTQLWFDGLRLVERTDFGLAGDDAEAERHFRIGTKEAGVVGMAAVFGLGFHANLVGTVGGHTLGEGEERAVGTLVLGGLRRLVEAHVTEILNPAVRVAELGLLLEIIGEAPSAFAGRLWGGQRFLDDLIGGVDVLG